MLDVFRANYTGGNRQTQYRSAIWFHSPQQQLMAEETRSAILRHSRRQLDVEPAKTWWKAEFYHQKYQNRTMMTLGLWAFMGSFCTIGGMVSLGARSAIKSLK
eukprot:TRINITY_DN71179_c0_g1_i1.p1 TRINITY_DN71179_c0_g1~~TRINITY_DN71179_c0_g1_i1.p1  ORF type:complete len:103 (+),score=15.08 TRINITY_DN71179_c0_g1_i1:291-599(+)